MERKIIRIGNSYGIIIPKHILKVMGWDIRKLEATLDIPARKLVVTDKQTNSLS